MWLSGRALFQHVKGQGFLSQQKDLEEAECERRGILGRGGPASFMRDSLAISCGEGGETGPMGLERGMEGNT